jgi:hypothetical protein
VVGPVAIVAGPPPRGRRGGGLSLDVQLLAVEVVVGVELASVEAERGSPLPAVAPST